jgi:DNA-directed RNA polymerase subunit RPC12/RpoP
MHPITDMTKTILKQIIGPIQQWLLEEGKCVSCGGALSAHLKGNEVESGAEVISCPCGQTYLYLPKAKLYKRLTANEYVQC